MLTQLWKFVSQSRNITYVGMIWVRNLCRHTLTLRELEPNVDEISLEVSRIAAFEARVVTRWPDSLEVFTCKAPCLTRCYIANLD